MRQSSSLDDILLDIKLLHAEDNLAAVLIHLNDTYFVDPRPPEIPGMSRIAGLVSSVRRTVLDLVGEDRTLVLHSGDYLSPSAMSRKYKGAQMVKMLRLCGLNYATFGNHEFDFGQDVFLAQLSQMAPCIHVIANLHPPSNHPMPEISFWPKNKPFLAITGLAGKQTIQKAQRNGFDASNKSLMEIAKDILVQCEVRGVSGVVILSHMDREEDKELQKLVSNLWSNSNSGFVYILGGHDHAIHWREKDRPNCFLSKCKSNCRSVTLFMLRKDAMAIPRKHVVGQLVEHSDEQDRKVLDHFAGDHKQLVEFVEWMAENPDEPIPERFSEEGFPDVKESQEELLNSVLEAYRSRVESVDRPVFRKAFERRVRVAFGNFTPNMIRESVFHGELARDVVSYAVQSAQNDQLSCDREISEPTHLHDLPLHEDAEAMVTKWVAEMSYDVSQETVIIDFTEEDLETDGCMDARDQSLRYRSTDFGNFVADAIRASTNAEVALINSGAFRIDSVMSAALTIGLLSDAFPYDEPGAIALVDLSAAEIKMFLEHAEKRGGHGAFLQLSELKSQMLSRSGIIKVALVTHTLEDPEDGYYSILSSTRKFRDFSELNMDVFDESMIKLIEKGAADGVRYCKDLRIIAKPAFDWIAGWGDKFISLADQLIAACVRHNLSESELRRLLRGELPVEALADDVRTLIVELIGHWREEAPTGQISSVDRWDYLAHCQVNFEKEVRYQDYFEWCAEEVAK